MRFHDFYESPHGRMLVTASEAGITGVHFGGQKYFPAGDAGSRREARNPLVLQAIRELAEYFAGERKRFEVVLAPAGTPFQIAIWRAIATVPYGETISYGELARRAGAPGHARAAGAATGRNPIGIIVPCHRIVGANGSLTGYAAGLARKRALLALEAGERELLPAA